MNKRDAKLQMHANSAKSVCGIRMYSRILHRVDGLTFIELLLTVAVISVLAVGSTAIYRNYVKNFEIESTAKTIISDLRGARAKAMAGESGLKWGIHFVNSTDNYYQIFSTPNTFDSPSTTISDTIYLQGGILFTDPDAGNTKDIIFNKITGAVDASASVSVNFESTTKTANVTTLGSIY